MTTPAASIPVSIDDPVNVAVLAVSEDQLRGFQRDPLGEIARRCGLPLPLVIERVRAMLSAGTIRRVRQTLLANKLAEGALVAWVVPLERLQSAFDYCFEQDPFSGHVVIRTTDHETAGSPFRLWTTLKVPQGYSLERHCEHLAMRIGAPAFRAMPAKALFSLGVGHVRRRGMAPGSRDDEPADVIATQPLELSELEWRVITALKREFAPDEIVRELWHGRAVEAGVTLDEFVAIAQGLERRGIMGRFSTFLEHVKPVAGGERVTRYNALFHWAVPAGREIEAGREVGRHHIMTHAYWREGGAEFANVNIMGVAHSGTDKAFLLEHKAAIDAHLAEAGIAASYTNVFWGGRSEIKPSEISPVLYQRWCEQQGFDADAMREPSSREG
ncbi:MAG: Lrp/AsnC family transcriptional regulator [Dehalococcoidia bacterium]|nr:Lrp/AsnC family transcriptional regulator [Dehalococcoidia bacterium]